MVQSVCLTSRGSGVRLPLLPLQEKHFGFPRCFFIFARHGHAPMGAHAPCPVRIKTFFAHVVSKFDPVVRKSGVFTHGRVLRGQSHQNTITHRRAFPAHVSIWYQINVLSGTKCLNEPTWYHLKRFHGTNRIRKCLRYHLKRFPRTSRSKCHVVSKPGLFTHEG